MDRQRITFVGAGNMARAIIGGLIADGYPAACIGATDIEPDKLRELSERFGIHTATDNRAGVEPAEVVVLAVKPQAIRAAALALKPTLGQRPRLFISIAAGIPLRALGRWLGETVPIVRAMPNTPALVATGAAALCPNSHVSSADRQTAEAILRAVGLAVWIEDEALMDPVTALSGSGPAYVFLLIEAMERAGIDLGLSPEHARLLTLQTVLGAARLAMESDADPAALRRQVTSPGGTTERALQSFEQGGFGALVARAISAANVRSRELAEQYGAA
jgi:pyrroline-5-carboxylate reductase